MESCSCVALTPHIPVSRRNPAISMGLLDAGFRRHDDKSKFISYRSPLVGRALARHVGLKADLHYE